MLDLRPAVLPNRSPHPHLHLHFVLCRASERPYGQDESSSYLRCPPALILCVADPLSSAIPNTPDDDPFVPLFVASVLPFLVSDAVLLTSKRRPQLSHSNSGWAQTVFRRIRHENDDSLTMLCTSNDDEKRFRMIRWRSKDLCVIAFCEWRRRRYGRPKCQLRENYVLTMIFVNSGGMLCVYSIPFRLS